jgi:hypothetical protein
MPNAVTDLPLKASIEPISKRFADFGTPLLLNTQGTVTQQQFLLMGLIKKQSKAGL